MISFWQRLKKPILALAPMEQVTDTVFRQIITGCGAPDVFFTEFTSVEGLTSAGKNKVDKRLKFTEKEHPIVAQIWGKTPEAFYMVAQEISEMGFDGIDINMGCPDHSIVKKGSCGALIKNHKLAAEVIQATKEGSRGLPVSVKTRIGFTHVSTHEWVQFLLEQKIDALTLHLRTVKEESKVPAHWDEMKIVLEVRNSVSPDTILIGNGDVKSWQEAYEKVEQYYGIDGVMIGRGIFENIWLFNKRVDLRTITPEDKLQLLLKHVDLFEKTWGETKNFLILRKFVKAYVNGFTGASDMRVKLMETKTIKALRSSICDILISLEGAYI